MAIWQIFSTGLIASSNSLIKAGSMIVKINFSKKSLVIASLCQSILSFLIQFIVCLILFFYYGISPKIYILLLPILIIPIFLLTLGLGFIFSILNGIMRDIGNALSILITFLMFLTPVLYAKPETGLLSKISFYNPLYYLVSFPRDLILAGNTNDLNGYIISTIFASIILLVCIFIFHLSETRIAERI